MKLPQRMKHKEDVQDSPVTSTGELRPDTRAHTMKRWEPRPLQNAYTILDSDPVWCATAHVVIITGSIHTQPVHDLPPLIPVPPLQRAHTRPGERGGPLDTAPAREHRSLSFWEAADMKKAGRVHAPE